VVTDVFAGGFQLPVIPFEEVVGKFKNPPEQTELGIEKAGSISDVSVIVVVILDIQLLVSFKVIV
jgi:hypothetical protein